MRRVRNLLAKGLASGIGSALIFGCLATRAEAASWAGENFTDLRWSLSANWQFLTLPGVGDSVFLDNGTNSITTAGQTLMNINCTLSFLSMNVSGATGTIDGDNGAHTMSMQNGSSVLLGPNTGTLQLGVVGNLLPLNLLGQVTFSDSSATQLIAVAGSLEGSGGITKAGSGRLRFNADNSGYSGAVTVSVGTVILFTSGGLGSGSAVLNGGTLSLQNVATAFASPVAVNSVAGNAFDVVGIASTASGSITGSGGFTKTGSGTLTLSHANSYSGGTSIAAGVLTLGSVTGVGSGSVTVGSGTIFNVAGFAPVIATLSGAGSVTLGSGTLTAGDSTATTFSGVISGTGKFIKQGSGSITFSGTNSSYSGGTFITGGMLVIAGDGSLGGIPGSPATNLTFSGSGGTLQVSGDVTLNANRNVLLSSNATFDTNSHALTIPGTLTGSGSLTEIGGGTLALTNYTTSAGTTVSNGILLMSGTNNSFAGITGTSGSLTIASSAAAVSDGVQLATLTVTGSHAIRANGTASGVSKVTTLSIAGSTGA